jgi:hypothetical protein
MNDAQTFPMIPQGWQCPVCKKVHAPTVLECDCQRMYSAVAPTTAAAPLNLPRWIYGTSVNIYTHSRR